MPLRHLIAACSLIIAGSAAAETFDMNLSSDSAQLKYGTLVGGSTYGRTEISTGFLYNEDDNSLFELGLHVVDVAGSKSPGLTLAVGPKLYYATTDDGDSIALGLGARMQYKLPEIKRLVIGASLYFAPSVTTFKDGENFFEGGLTLEYELLPTANAYIGFRNIRTRLEDHGSTVIDKGGMAGLRFTF
jgi:hypothetical protein